MRAAISLNSVTAGYGKRTVLHNLDLELRPGLHTLLGANGAGKTTLFRVVAGVLRPRSGRVMLRGRDLYDDPEAKHEVGYLTHRPGLHPHVTVRDNLVYWARVRGIPRARIDEEIDRVRAELPIDDVLHRRVGKLSRGQMQRASIARVLLGDPRILLCDEPTTGLDPIAAANMRALLRRLASGERVVLYSTHNLYEASELSEEVLMLANGALRDRGTVASLSQRHLGRRRVGVRVSRDPEAAFARAGVTARREDRFWVFDAANDADVSTVVRACAEEKIDVYEVRELDNALEGLYRRLDGTSASAGAGANGSAAREVSP